MHFIAPTDDKPAWRLAEQRLDAKQPNRMRTVGEVRTAQVIDVVPGSLERWVLRATQEIADSLLSADEWAEDSEKATHLHNHGLRLSSECEQAEAHSRRWQERFDGQYGEIVIYELRSDEPIVYERTEEDGRPALLMGNAGENAHVILVALTPTTRGDAHLLVTSRNTDGEYPFTRCSSISETSTMIG